MGSDSEMLREVFHFHPATDLFSSVHEQLVKSDVCSLGDLI